MRKPAKEKGKYASASTHLTIEEMELIRQEAEEKEWSVSKIIRKAVRQYFGLEKSKSVETKD